VIGTIRSIDLKECVNMSQVELKEPKRTPAGRLIPTGNCWFCNKQLTGNKTFFCHGHDKSALAWVILEEFGGVAEFIAKLGYFPGGSNNFEPVNQS
jgi:hypothetical protein